MITGCPIQADKKMETLKYLNINFKEATGFIYNDKDSYCDMAVQNLRSLYEEDNKTPDFPSRFFENVHGLQIVTSLSPAVWSKLPIDSHQVVVPESRFVECINQAAFMLENVSAWSLLSKFLGGVCVLKLKSSQRHKDIKNLRES